MLDHRMQLLLDQTRYAKVSREAKKRGSSVAAVIRDAIDLLPNDDVDRLAACEAILSAEPMDVPDDPQAIRREVDEVISQFG